jgi:hypothetical protein
MSEVWKAIGLCDCASEGSNILTATASRCEASRHLHGMLSEVTVTNRILDSDYTYTLY